jgi:hypothetical protein
MTGSRDAVKQLNKQLTNDYGFGIFPFALSLAIHILDFPTLGTILLWEKKNVVPDYWLSLREEMQRLERTSQRLMSIVEELDEHLEGIRYWEFLRGQSNYLRDLIRFPGFLMNSKGATRPLVRSEIVRKNYSLQPAIDRIAEEMDFYKGFEKASRKKGRPVNTRMIIASLWSQVMKKRGRVQWEAVERLRDWFYSKLEGTEYRSRIEELPALREVESFKTKHKRELRKERKLLFRKYSNPNNPMGLQINFAKDSPEIWATGSLTEQKEIPVIRFLDGTTFP